MIKTENWINITGKCTPPPIKFKMDGNDLTTIQVNSIQMDDHPADSCAISPTAFLLHLFINSCFCFFSLRHSVNGDFCGHSRFVLWHENLTTFVS